MTVKHEISVVEGTRQVFGVDGRPVAAEVFRTNMAKLSGPVDPATGKKLKPPGWVPREPKHRVTVLGYRWT